MKIKTELSIRGRVALLIGMLICSFAGTSMAGDISALMQNKIDKYKKQAAIWAADPMLVKAIKEANANGSIAGMGNSKWRELKETDPIVQAFITFRKQEPARGFHFHAGDLYRERQAQFR
jgi:hypothetical protein